MNETYLQDLIFGQDSDKIVSKVLESYESSRTDETEEGLYAAGRTFVEVGVRLGYFVSKHQPNSFVEIGCGFAIPSLTLVKLGVTFGEAFDFDPNVLMQGDELAHDLNLKLNYIERDFYEWEPSLPEGTYLIADKPTGLKPNNGFERDILDLAQRQGHNIALNPLLEIETTDSEYDLKCDGYIRELTSNGFKVETAVLNESPFYRVILGTK